MQGENGSRAPVLGGAPRSWVVVTCMGRLAHLRVTAPPIIATGEVGYCLVDFSCPDACGHWLAREYAGELAAGRVCIVSCPGERVFHKTRAQNLGARRAVEAGAEQLCFSDADTLLRPQTLQRVQALQPGRFLIAGNDRLGRSIRSLTGLLALTAGDFARSGGYEEEFIGWGSEDIAMRLKLHLALGLEAVALPFGAAHAIPHSDNMRIRYAADPDLVRNAERNDALLRRYVERWTGQGLKQLPPSAKALLFNV